MTNFGAMDLRHTPGPDHDWQEPVVLVFLDQATGLTGYFRSGTQPNIPACQEWIYLQTPDGTRFRRLRFGLPITAKTRPDDGFGAGGLEWTYQADYGWLKCRTYYVHVEKPCRDFCRL